MIKGQARNISAKPFDGRNGPVTLYSFQLEGDRRYFRTGTTQPPMAAGEFIEFTAVEKNGNFNVNIDTIQTIAQQEVQQAPKPSGQTDQPSNTSGSTGAPTGGDYNPHKDYSNKDNYWARREERDLVTSARINYSASQRDAITLIVAALEQDCLSFGNVAKGKKLDMLYDFIDKATERFAEQRNNVEVSDGS